MGVRLPAEYQEIEYIKGINDTTYINTGVKPASDISIFGVFSFQNRIYSSLFGARSSAGWWFVSMSDATAPATPAFWYNSTLIRAQLPYNDDGDWFQITMSNTNGSIFDADGVLLLSKDFNAVDFPDLDMYLFVRNQNDTPVGNGTVGCKRFVIYKSNATVRDFIPCYRKADNEPGMYDLVSGTFFVNQGTGEFTVGPDVIDSISPLMVAWRRELMKPAEYVKDGLVLWLDGINKGDTENAWTDKVSGYIFNASENVIFGADYVDLNGVNAYLSNTEFVSPNPTVGTIEIVITDYAKNSTQLCFMPKYDGIALGLYNNTALWSASTNAFMNCVLIPDDASTISINRNIAIANMQQQSFNSDSRAWTGGTENNFIGRRNGGNYFAGKIHSIRIYNRRLTQKEMMHNQKIDNQRFNLGL